MDNVVVFDGKESVVRDDGRRGAATADEGCKGLDSQLWGKAEGLAVSQEGERFGRRRTCGRKGRQATTNERGWVGTKKGATGGVRMAYHLS